MNLHRKLVKTYTPPTQQGFLGAGHLARPVIQVDFTQSDPFIILMDDRLDKQDEHPVGGPHPHAGFETVSLLLEGSIGDEAHQMKGGDLQLMTAGSGIVHTETIEGKASMRLLQLWLNLPKKDRWATPRVQDLPLAKVPTSTHNGTTIRVYSGSLAGLTSPIQNYTPLILADIHLQPGTTTVQHLPASFIMSTTKWVLDPTHSELGFKIRHLMISNVSGSFQQFQVDVETQDDDFSTAQIRATAQIASIHTNNEQRDHHLRNSDFFEAEIYPHLSFQSTKIEKLSDDTFTVYGDLTMKGVRKPVNLTVEYSGVTKDPWGDSWYGPFWGPYQRQRNLSKAG